MGQRFWNVLVAIIAGLTLAGCTAAGAGPSVSSRTAAPAPSPGGPRAALCRPGALTLAYGPRLSPMTGEHGGFYGLVNHGHATCTLAGYPQVRLYADGDPLPFRYMSGGGPYVTGRPPASVTVRPGGTAWILVAKYRCDLGALRSATTISVTVPGMAGSVLTRPVSPDRAGVSDLAYCRGGTGDPGQTVTVSPIESSPYAASKP